MLRKCEDQAFSCHRKNIFYDFIPFWTSGESNLRPTSCFMQWNVFVIFDLACGNSYQSKNWVRFQLLHALDHLFIRIRCIVAILAATLRKNALWVISDWRWLSDDCIVCVIWHPSVWICCRTSVSPSRTLITYIDFYQSHAGGLTIAEPESPRNLCFPCIET